MKYYHCVYVRTTNGKKGKPTTRENLFTHTNLNTSISCVYRERLPPRWDMWWNCPSYFSAWKWTMHECVYKHASKFDIKSNSFIVIILPSVPLVVLLVYPKSVLRAACGRVELGAWTRRLQPPCVAPRTLDHRQGFPPAGASAA